MTSYTRNAFIYASIVAMGGFIFGLDAALISGAVKYLVQEFGLNDLQLGTVVSAPGLGVFLALPLAGYASNALGRKKTLQLIGILYLISAVSSALAPSYWALVIARLLGGLAWGSITLASMYIGEIAPPKARGKLVSMTQINIVVGLSAAYFINYLILQLTNSDAAWISDIGLKDYTWRWMFGSEIFFALIWFGLLLLIPKSPSWLVYKGRLEEAKRVLAKILPDNEIPQHIAEMQTSLAKSPDDLSVVSQMKEIFGKPMRVIFIVAITIAIAQQSTGINAILFYAPTVFEQIGMGMDAAFMQAIWIGLTSVVFTIFALLLIDKIGRRPMVLWGMVWIILSLGLCSYAFNNARYTITEEAITEMTDFPNPDKIQAIVGTEFRSDIEFKQVLKETLGEEEARNHSSLLLQKATKMNAMLVLFGILSFIAAFHFSVGPIMWVLFSELFPIALRGIAIPFFALITSFVSYLVILYRYLPETKNMSIEEIQAAIKK